MMSNLVLVCFLSFVSGKFVPENGKKIHVGSSTLAAKDIKENMEDAQNLNSALMEHIQDLLRELAEIPLSGTIGNEELKFWFSGGNTKICREKCEEESTIGNIICITNNFISSIVYYSTGYTDCPDQESCSGWSYPSQNWTSICPDYCNGTRQSPIDIEVDLDSLLSPTIKELLTYNDYATPISTVNLKNNGHTVIITWDTMVNSPSISGGELGADYTLANLHFHWGCENNRGSEHKFNGQSGAMEMHLVHYKTSYGNLGEAIKHSDGLAVLGVVFIVGNENQALKPITDNLSQITEPGTETDIEFDISLEKLLPSENQFFGRYEGSVPTPTCNEVVSWSLFWQAVELSQAQIDAFRSIKDDHNAYLCDNKREVQPLNERIMIYFNPPPQLQIKKIGFL